MLKRSSGWARCAQCDTDFNALEALFDEPVDPKQSHWPGEDDHASTTPAAGSQPAGIAEAAAQDASDRNWRIVLFVLVALTIVNLSWSFRGPLLDQAWLRNDLIEWGLVQDPSKTMLRDLDHLRLVSRSLQAHASRAGVLVLKVTFAIDAVQAQPWPLMELTLLDTTGGLVAQRRFSPSEYLGRELGKGELLLPGMLVPVRLEIADPGIQTSGFELRFF